MALIVESKYTSAWYAGPPQLLKDKASDFKFDIPSLKLSRPYSLKDGDLIEGIILRVEDLDKKEYPDLNGKRVNFILYTVLAVDYLFISKTDWETMFREYGLVNAFYISARLEKAIQSSGVESDLYTKSDLRA